MSSKSTRKHIIPHAIVTAADSRRVLHSEIGGKKTIIGLFNLKIFK